MIEKVGKLYRWRGSYADRDFPREMGFEWKGKQWVTQSLYVVLRSQMHGERLAQALVHELREQLHNLEASESSSDVLADNIPSPRGREYFPYQSAGILHAATQLQKRHSHAIFDEQGLGKTIQAIGVANLLKLPIICVVCPASLRLNWCREIANWHTCGQTPLPILSGASHLPRDRSVVVSYDLAGKVLPKIKPDLLVVDEAHYIKNPQTKRAKAVLAAAAKIKTLWLSGTPLPNGRPIELYPLLRKTAWDVLDCATYGKFLRNWCQYYADQGTIVVTGVKNEEDLLLRLRASGWMTRRLKSEVYKQLPAKRHDLILLSADSNEVRRVLEQEKNFSADEIIEHGEPVGTALPEIRKEMGLAKMPQVAEYVRTLLDGGVEKVVVFGHHVAVTEGLAELLSAYGSVLINGAVPPIERQKRVDRFQTDPACRVIVANMQAGGTGFTLTKAHDVVLAEPSWVPGVNDQACDRCHRIGQTERVIIHYMCVERSLDAKILGSAARKRTHASITLDRSN